MKKIKKSLKETFHILLPIFFHFENICLTIFFFQKMKENNIYVLLAILFLLFEIRYLIFSYKNFLGKNTLQGQLKQNKTIGIGGSQGRGKTSLCLFIATVFKSKKIYANIPCKINHKFNYELEEDIFKWKKKPYENSLLIYDEISLFYHNLAQKNEKEAELFLQLIRHAIGNGANFICNSVSINRIPKQIEEKLSTFFKIIKQYSFFPTISSYILKLFKINAHYRCWFYLKLDTIDVENYTYDLSNTKNDKYSFVEKNLVTCFNLDPKFEYNDRYYSKLFKDVEISKKMFNSLEMSETEKQKVLDRFFKKEEIKKTTTKFYGGVKK